MAQSQKRSGAHRIVKLTPEAEEDRFLAYIHTEQEWGGEQAKKYDEFLQAVMQELADHTSIAPVTPNFPGYRRYTARWKNSRHGHHIFFEETDEGISVVRILHTAMEWRDHLA